MNFPFLLWLYFGLRNWLAIRRLLLAFLLERQPFETFGATAAKTNTRGDADNGRIVGHISQYNTIRCDDYVIADSGVANHFGAGPEIHIVSDTSCGGSYHDPGLNGAIRSNSCWTDEDAIGSMNEQPRTDLRVRRNKSSDEQLHQSLRNKGNDQEYLL